MAFVKSCLQCDSKIPANSLSNLCNACTPTENIIDPRNTFSPEVTNQRSDAKRAERPQHDETVDSRETLSNAARYLLATHAEYSPDDAIPKIEFPKIDNYEIRREIGRGTSGVVYEARHIESHRSVAVKLLPGKPPAERERFQRVARSLSKIKHPTVVEIFEVGECDTGPYFSMELMTGGSLFQKLKSQGKLSAQESAKLLETLARGLAVVHKAGILHCDLKPRNVLFDEHDNPKIADSGLAKAWLSESDTAALPILSTTDDQPGSPAYLAPEQTESRHADIDARTDVYGLGGILYQALTGRPPFTGPNAMHLAQNISSVEPIEPRVLEKSIPRDLEAICLTCLEKRSKDRYVGAAALAKDLAAWQRGEPTKARPASPPKKMARWLWKKRKYLLAVSSLVMIVASINFVGMWFNHEDPDAELKKIRNELESGKVVTLIDAVGKPRWHSSETGPIEFSVSDFGGEVCCFEAKEVKFLELLPEADVPSSFTFKAEVRHERGDNQRATTGLYVGRWNNKSSEDTEEIHSIRIDYEDAFHAANAIPENYAFVAPTIHLYHSNQPPSVLQQFATKKPITSKLTTKWTWRTLTVICQNNQTLEFSLTPDQSPFDRETLNSRDLSDFYLMSHGNRQPGTRVLERALENPLRGGLGVHNSFGKASFRNVTIQKQTE